MSESVDVVDVLDLVVVSVVVEALVTVPVLALRSECSSDDELVTVPVWVVVEVSVAEVEM